MNRQLNQRSGFALALALAGLALSGCGTVGHGVADLGLAGAGGVVGYEVSGKKIGGAAAGAAVGYIASKVAQTEVQKGQTEAERRGYDRALNQAVKQQYWIMQNRQRAHESTEEREARLVPVVIPETNINGVIQKARVEYMRTEP